MSGLVEQSGEKRDNSESESQGGNSGTEDDMKDVKDVKQLDSDAEHIKSLRSPVIKKTASKKQKHR